MPETQAKDVQIGQSATIDTRNGVVDGKVSRKDPAAQNGTVTVDVAPRRRRCPRARVPDLTVDGTIELERLDRHHLCQPARRRRSPTGTVGLFKLDPTAWAPPG